jgi:4-amino-4-deoxy-L-arabinose transferase-like glycosyltransferase
MSPLARPPALRPATPPARETPRVAPKAPVRVERWRETATIFLSAFAVYLAVGVYTTVDLHVVIGDAESRLAHAFFVWWNEPQKLASIGFYWPPLQSLVLLPAAAVRPLATSLVALPLTSACFGAALVVTLDRALGLPRLDRPVRWLILAAFALNPLVLFYAANGMAEIVYLFFLTVALTLFVRWLIEPRWSDLPLIGLAFGLGVLARYEVGLWLPLVVLAALVLLAQGRARAARLEATALVLVVPGIYAVLTWTFIDWTITGQPLGFLGRGLPGGEFATEPLAGLLGESLLVTFLVFPPTLLLAAILVGVWLRRRELAALILAAALLLNLLTTIALLIRFREPFFLQHRYNLRATPIVIVALAWLLTQVPPERRRAAGLAAAAVIALAIPVTGVTMLTYPQALGSAPAGTTIRKSTGAEGGFLEALLLGEDQDPAANPDASPADRATSIADQRDMARYISANVSGRNAVLTDDSRTFGVMLMDGHPERYLDRIDQGDEYWFRVLRDPVGRVDYFLVQSGATRARDLAFFDAVVDAYPGLAGGGSPPPFLRRVYANPTYALYRVAKPSS